MLISLSQVLLLHGKLWETHAQSRSRLCNLCKYQLSDHWRMLQWPSNLNSLQYLDSQHSITSLVVFLGAGPSLGINCQVIQSHTFVPWVHTLDWGSYRRRAESRTTLLANCSLSYTILSFFFSLAIDDYVPGTQVCANFNGTLPPGCPQATEALSASELKLVLDSPSDQNRRCYRNKE